MEITYPLISVIVPVYNVESYLHRCVDSILAQTYPNIEVVLVDDGSPDRCGEICDDYARKDSRVIVVHRKNGGLSAARNSGLEVCHGEYIGFVDSDDFIHPEMYEQLYNDVTRFSTSLAFCHTDVIRNGKGDGKKYGSGSEVQPNTYVMRRALEESIWWSACTKLYHKSIVNGIRFPEGKTNEDMPVTIRIFDRCDQIAINHSKLYFYYIRENSITTSRLNPRKFDVIDNASNVIDYLHDTHPELMPAAKGILLSNALGLLLKLRNHQGNDLETERKKTLSAIRRNWPSLLTNTHLSAWQRTLLTAAALHPQVLYRCYDLRKRMKRST